MAHRHALSFGLPSYYFTLEKVYTSRETKKRIRSYFNFEIGELFIRKMPIRKEHIILEIISISKPDTFLTPSCISHKRKSLAVKGPILIKVTSASFICKGNLISTRINSLYDFCFGRCGYILVRTPQYTCIHKRSV